MQIQKAAKHFIFCLLIFLPHLLQAQSLAGLTHTPDTSFNNVSALRSALKSFPGISLAEVPASPLVKEQKNIYYGKTGKRKLYLDVFETAAKPTTQRTGIIIIYGGGWRSGNRTQHYSLARKLAALGYTCFTPEYRLSTEALYPAAVCDLKTSVQYVRSKARKFHLDTNRIVVLGFSAGGELAAFLGATNGIARFYSQYKKGKHSSNVNAVIDVDGTLSFVHEESGEGDDSKRISAATYWFGFSKKEHPALWADASPLTHVHAQTAPFLFLNSAVDRMHAGRTDFIDALNRYNIYSEVQHFENSPHTFLLFNPWFDPSVKYIDAFLQKVFLH